MRHASFVANADAVQAFGTTDQFTAEYLSKMAGTATVFHQSQSSGRSRGKHSSRSSSAGATETGRPLVTPDELRRLGRVLCWDSQTSTFVVHLVGFNGQIDEAYRATYGGSPYLGAMISDRARGATIRVSPRAGG